MPNQDPFFRKSIFKILTAAIAFSALCVSILFSQSSAQNKKEKKKDPTTIFPSSKSMGPPFPKKEKPEPKKEPDPSQEQSNSIPKQENKIEEQKQEPKKDKVENNTEKKKKPPIMPSSKAPDPGSY